jgi:hypothetical protein
VDLALAQFSDWTLALLPRLFLYPGGLWALGGLLLLCARDGPQTLLPSSLATWLLRANLPSAAVAWAAMALLPLPGATSLPVPVDRFALAGLLTTSLLLNVYAGRSIDVEDAVAGVVLPLAALAPLVGGLSLLQSGDDWGLSGWLALAAIVVALLLQPDGMESDIRTLGWLGLGAAPVWAALVGRGFNAVLLVSLVYGLLLVVIGRASRLRLVREARSGLTAASLGLAGLSMLLPLLG